MRIKTFGPSVIQHQLQDSRPIHATHSITKPHPSEHRPCESSFISHLFAYREKISLARAVLNVLHLSWLVMCKAKVSVSPHWRQLQLEQTYRTWWTPTSIEVTANALFQIHLCTMYSHQKILPTLILLLNSRDITLHKMSSFRAILLMPHTKSAWQRFSVLACHK